MMYEVCEQLLEILQVGSKLPFFPWWMLAVWPIGSRLIYANWPKNRIGQKSGPKTAPTLLALLNFIFALKGSTVIPAEVARGLR